VKTVSAYLKYSAIENILGIIENQNKEKNYG
jgi:hypothetical protein